MCFALVPTFTRNNTPAKCAFKVLYKCRLDKNMPSLKNIYISIFAQRFIPKHELAPLRQVLTGRPNLYYDDAVVCRL